MLVYLCTRTESLELGVVLLTKLLKRTESCHKVPTTEPPLKKKKKKLVISDHLENLFPPNQLVSYFWFYRGKFP